MEFDADWKVATVSDVYVLCSLVAWNLQNVWINLMAVTQLLDLYHDQMRTGFARGDFVVERRVINCYVIISAPSYGCMPPTS